jgi:hypothetical protein
MRIFMILVFFSDFIKKYDNFISLLLLRFLITLKQLWFNFFNVPKATCFLSQSYHRNIEREKIV